MLGQRDVKVKEAQLLEFGNLRCSGRFTYERKEEKVILMFNKEVSM